jgi:hypothetical protein
MSPVTIMTPAVGVACSSGPAGARRTRAEAGAAGQAGHRLRIRVAWRTVVMRQVMRVRLVMWRGCGPVSGGGVLPTICASVASSARWASVHGGGKVSTNGCGQVSEGRVGKLTGRSGNRFRGKRSCPREVDYGSDRPVLPSEGHEERGYELRCRSFPKWRHEAMGRVVPVRCDNHDP